MHICAMIKHNAMLAQMNTGEKFSVAFVTLDRKRNKGGDLVTLKNVRKHQAGNIQQHTEADVAQATGAPDKVTNPKHAAHGTINLKCADNSLIKVHTRLIVKFNNEEVTL